MKIKKYIFAFALCMGSLTSCVDLDIYGHENEVYNSMMSFCNVND